MVKNLKGRDHFEGLDMDRKEVTKLLLEKYCGRACMDWSDELRVPLQAYIQKEKYSITNIQLPVAGFIY